MGGAVSPPCCLTCGQTMVEVMKIMAPPCKVLCMHCCTQCPQLCHRSPPTHASAGDSRKLTGKSGSVSCGVTAPFFWVLVHTKFCLCQSCVKFWWLYGGVNGDLLQEGLRHTKVYHSQNPCPRSSPLLTHTSSGDTQTQFCLSLCGVSGS